MFKYIDRKNSKTPPLAIGDIVFIRISNRLFGKVAEASNSWSNHVGVIVEHNGTDWVVAESCVPLVRRRSLTKFVARSEDRRYAIRRLPRSLSETEQTRLRHAADQRMGLLYHTGFALHSKRQFCSKFVHEVLREACGEEIGEIETFATLLNNNPQTALAFWKVWFFGRIPWQRETITPASQLRSSKMHTVFASH